MFDQPGALVANPHNIGPEALATVMRGQGFKWCATLIHDGLTIQFHEDYIQNQWINRFRRAAPELKVYGWGPLRTNPVEEAKLVESLTVAYATDGYVANPEYEYELTNDGRQDPVRFERSGKFCGALGPVTKGRVLGMTTFGLLANHDLHYKPWYDLGFHVLPQAYVANQRELTPANAMAKRVLNAPQHDGFKEWPANRVHPMISTEALNLGRVSVGDHVVLLRIARDTQAMKGYSIFVAEGVKDFEWPVYGDFNREAPMGQPDDISLEEAVASALEPLLQLEAQWDAHGTGHATSRVTTARRILEDSLSVPQKLDSTELRTLRDTLDVMGVRK